MRDCFSGFFPVPDSTCNGLLSRGRFCYTLASIHPGRTEYGEAVMKSWEYKIINVRSENYSMDPRRAEELNRLGDEGWELVSITSINFKTGATDHIGMVFKREKSA